MQGWIVEITSWTATSEAMATDLETTPEALETLYGIDAEDLGIIRTVGAFIVPRLDDVINRFYDWLQTQPEREMVTDADMLQRLHDQQVVYWTQFFAGRVDETYVAARRALGELHARVGLPLPAYFAAMNRMLTIFTEELCESAANDAERVYPAITRLIHLDTALVVEAYSDLVRHALTEQSRAMMSMSTPVATLWRDILMLPIVGIIDSKRAQDIMHAMLREISETQSKVMILDISGVAVVDTAVANHLIKITKATRLLGCTCTLSGISPVIAQTMVELGIEVGAIRTTATLADALLDGFRQVGTRIVEDCEQ